jgi:hypothetical protein
MVLPGHVLPAVEVRLKTVSNEEHFTLEIEYFFGRISPRISVGSLSNTTWFSLRMSYKHCKLG